MDPGDSPRSINLWLICACAALDGADLMILPASFRAMESSLALPPVQLATLAIGQAVAFAMSGPLWANLADNGFPRKKLLCAGACAWSICSLLLGFVSNFQIMVAIRIVNGVALSMVTPIGQLIVAEASPYSRRGYNFGWIDLSRSFGQLFSAVVMTSISNQTVLGVEGWRFGLFAMAWFSLALAILITFLMDERPRQWHPERVSILNELRKFVAYFEIPTFTVIVVQGIFNTIPYAALSFGTLYFQYLGMADWQAAAVFSMVHFGGGLGALLGGVIGDRLAAVSPSYGRPLTAQMSVFFGIPLAAIIFSVRSVEGGMYFNVGGLMLMLGLFSSWSMPGCIKPILLQIVSAGSQASAMAWMLAVEQTFGRFIGPLAVGLISEKVFGYTSTTDQLDTMAAEVRSANADALGKSLLLATILPWSICFGLYGFLHYTYRHDVRSEGLLNKASSKPSGADDIVDYS